MYLVARPSHHITMTAPAARKPSFSSVGIQLFIITAERPDIISLNPSQPKWISPRLHPAAVAMKQFNDSRIWFS
jgi:hypothetical protein